MLIYKAVQSNIASKDKKKKWHPCLIKMGNVVDTQMIGETIAERSSLTAGDVHNVIRNLMAVMREQSGTNHGIALPVYPGIYAGCRWKYHPCADSGSDIYPRQPVDESTGSGRRWKRRRFG